MAAWVPWSTALTIAKTTMKASGFVYAAEPAAAVAAEQQLPGLSRLILRFDDGRVLDQSSDAPEAGEPEFRLARLSDPVLTTFVYRFHAKGDCLDADLVEYVVRRGCLGHRNLRDADGQEIPSQVESDKRGRVLLSPKTYAAYELSGIPAVLAVVLIRRPALLER